VTYILIILTVYGGDIKHTCHTAAEALAWLQRNDHEGSILDLTIHVTDPEEIYSTLKAVSTTPSGVSTEAR
jgi:hypothetical protein